jgi:hypothetical protein
MGNPRVDIFNNKHGFILFDGTKKDPEDAERIADVVSKSRKAWLRVVQNGKVIASYDRRDDKEANKCSKISKKVCRKKNTRS